MGYLGVSGHELTIVLERDKKRAVQSAVTVYVKLEA